MENSKLKSLLEAFLNPQHNEFDADKLPNISNMPQLITWWKDTSSDSKSRELIEARMVEVLKEVVFDTIPDWFVILLQEDIPKFLQKAYKEKAQEIYDQL